MIRPGKAIDAPALADLLSAACIASRYGGRVNVDMRMARQLFAQAAMKHGFTNEGGMFLMVNEDANGEIDAFILGALSRIYVVFDMLASSDLFLIAREGNHDPRAMNRLVDAYIEWADHNPKVFEIGLSWADTLPGAERLAPFFERKGFQRCGETFRRTAQHPAIEEAA